MLTKKNIIVVALLLFTFGVLGAQNVLVWDYDNGYTIPNTDTGNSYGIEQGVVNALEDNDIEPDVLESLPADISEYDIVFVIAGVWCYS